MHTFQAGSTSIESLVRQCYLMAERSQMLAAYPVASDVPLRCQAVSQFVSFMAADKSRCRVHAQHCPGFMVCCCNYAMALSSA